MKVITMRTILLAALLAVALIGCEKKTGGTAAPSTGTAAANAPSGAPLPDGLLLTAAPEGAQELVAGLANAKDGDKVTIRGRVGGRKEPFVPGRAAMVMVDLAVPYCGEKVKDDHCATPWDYCCEPVDQLAKNAVAVQFDGPDGNILKADLNGAGGIAPLRVVIVQGTLRQAETARTLHATGIYVVPK